MHERYKTLGAVLALGEFSVSELAELSGVREPTVRTILRRESTFVEQIGTQATGRRGGQLVRWRLQPAAREQLRAQLQELERLGAGPWLTDQHDHDVSHAEIISAEDVLLSLASTTIDPVERTELIKLAEAQLDAANVSMAASHGAQASTANRSLDRDRRIVELLLTLEQVEQDTIARRDRILQEARVQAEELTIEARSRARDLERKAEQRNLNAWSEVSTIHEEINALTRQRDELAEQITAMTGEWMPSLAAQVASSAADVFDFDPPSGRYKVTVGMASGSTATHDYDRPADRSTSAKDHSKGAESESGSAAATKRTTWTGTYLRWAALVDCVSAFAGGLFALAAVINVYAHSGISSIPVEYLIFTAFLPVLWLGSVAVSGGYDARFIGVGSDEFRKVLSAAVVLTAGLAILSYVAGLGLLREYVLIALPCAAALDLALRYSLRRRLHRLWRRGQLTRRTVAVGHAAQVADLVALLRRDHRHGLSIVAACVVGTQSEHKAVADIPIYGGLDSVASVVSRFDVDTVAVLASPEMNGIRLRELAWDLESTGTEMYVAASLLDVAGPRTTIRPVAGLPLLHVDHAELTGGRQILKSVFDKLVAVTALVLLSPLFVAIPLAIKLTDRGPVFFRQVRVGKNGHTFKVWKFRTMVVDAEQRKAELNEGAGPLFKMRRDPRVTRAGVVLRRYSLDELPQLFNVLMGSMSLVGPRPALPAEAARYGDHTRRRLAVKPGITGLWQINGRSDLPWDDAVRLDLRYVENWSFALDLQILWKTWSAVFRGSGAY